MDLPQFCTLTKRGRRQDLGRFRISGAIGAGPIARRYTKTTGTRRFRSHDSSQVRDEAISTSVFNLYHSSSDKHHGRSHLRLGRRRRGRGKKEQNCRTVPCHPRERPCSHYTRYSHSAADRTDYCPACLSDRTCGTNGLCNRPFHPRLSCHEGELPDRTVSIAKGPGQCCRIQGRIPAFEELVRSQPRRLTEIGSGCPRHSRYRPCHTLSRRTESRATEISGTAKLGPSRRLLGSWRECRTHSNSKPEHAARSGVCSPARSAFCSHTHHPNDGSRLTYTSAIYLSTAANRSYDAAP